MLLYAEETLIIVKLAIKLRQNYDQTMSWFSTDNIISVPNLDVRAWSNDFDIHQLSVQAFEFFTRPISFPIAFSSRNIVN